MNEAIGTLIAVVIVSIVLAFIDAGLALLIVGNLFPQFDFMEWARIMFVLTLPVGTAIGVSRMSA